VIGATLGKICGVDALLRVQLQMHRQKQRLPHRPELQGAEWKAKRTITKNEWKSEKGSLPETNNRH